MAEQEPLYGGNDERRMPNVSAHCPIPDDPGGNGSWAITYVSGNPTQIDFTLNTITYRRTLTFTGDDLTAVSVWSQV